MIFKIFAFFLLIQSVYLLDETEEDIYLERLSMLKKAQYFLKNNNFTEALGLLKQLIQYKPNNIFFNANIAYSYYKLNNFNLAIEHADKALHSTDVYTLAKKVKSYSLYKLGRIEYLEKNYKQASIYYLKAFQLRPNEKIILTNIGLIEFKTQNFTEAAYYSLMALNIDKDYKLAKIIYAKSLFEISIYLFFLILNKYL